VSIQLSSAIVAKMHGSRTFSVKTIDLGELGGAVSPLALFDEFRVSGSPFGPHPHAGFTAITYVFEDSPGALRSRDSLGNDLTVGPGGIVLLQSGRGALHEETPAETGRELRGAQIYINLSAKNKRAVPSTLMLQSRQVPEWSNADGDRVRVVVGSFAGVASPLTPLEPFTLLDIDLQREISLDLPNAHNALVYVRQGSLLAQTQEDVQAVPAEHALMLHGDGGRVSFAAVGCAKFMIVAGAEIRERVIAKGPFIMNEPAEIELALERYHSGEMGDLKPRPKG
jgi:redox-sensitive bicupin YhaK (pirin superfamily)